MRCVTAICTSLPLIKTGAKDNSGSLSGSRHGWEPGEQEVRSAADNSQFTAEFRRDLEGSDPLHWGEGTLYIGPDSIALEGRLAPGPDYRLFLSPQFVETEAAFQALKAQMIEVGPVRTFENFMVPVSNSVDPAAFSAAIVWCESFNQFITAARYQ